jgi:uncharacterized protein (TIGR02145 family)
MKIILKRRLFSLLFIGNVLILADGCSKDDELVISLPVLTTCEVTGLTQITAISGGNITSDGGAAITARGICWSTNQMPITSNSKTTDGAGTGSFQSQITGITANITYYLRAYAVNSAGTAYGNEQSFISWISVPGSAVNDADGNSYPSVKIGTQIWMAKNLRTTKFRNGDQIITTAHATLNIESESNPKYQWAYEGKGSNAAVYGRLYTWYAVMDPRGVCPAGWHIPTIAETATLSTFLGGWDVAGGKMKEAGTAHWEIPNAGATNESGFTAIPGGYRSMYGLFMSTGTLGFFWSSDEGYMDNAWYRYMNSGSNVLGGNSYFKKDGLSVRCLKDQQ